MDYGHKVANKNLILLEKRMEREYAQAYAEMKVKADAYFVRFSQADKEKLKELSAGKITKKEYIEWRRRTMLTGKRYKAMVAGLADRMTETNRKAMRMLGTTLIDAFVENYNFGGYEVSKLLRSNITFTLMNPNVVTRLVKENPTLLPKPRVAIAKDKLWNRRKMNSALTQGILQGESIDKISKRLMSVTDMNRHSAVRNARTMTTGAENSGRLESYRQMSDMGIPVMKKWVATLDHVTRDSHVDVDGEVQELDHPFSNGLDYPGAVGPPEEVYNCRCSIVSEIKGHRYEDNRYSKLGNMTYKEWKRNHAKE